jgi:hypothetical protein
MKVAINFPCGAHAEYNGICAEDLLRLQVGDPYDVYYIVSKKTVINDLCILSLAKKDEIKHSDNLTKQGYGVWVIQEFIKEIEAHTPRGLIENGETDMECVVEAANSLIRRLEEEVNEKTV